MTDWAQGHERTRPRPWGPHAQPQGRQAIKEPWVVRLSFSPANIIAPQTQAVLMDRRRSPSRLEDSPVAEGRGVGRCRGRSRTPRPTAGPSTNGHGDHTVAGVSRHFLPEHWEITARLLSQAVGLLTGHNRLLPVDGRFPSESRATSRRRTAGELTAFLLRVEDTACPRLADPLRGCRAQRFALGCCPRTVTALDHAPLQVVEGRSQQVAAGHKGEPWLATRSNSSI